GAERRCPPVCSGTHSHRVSFCIILPPAPRFPATADVVVGAARMTSGASDAGRHNVYLFVSSPGGHSRAPVPAPKRYHTKTVQEAYRNRTGIAPARRNRTNATAHKGHAAARKPSTQTGSLHTRCRLSIGHFALPTSHCPRNLFKCQRAQQRNPGTSLPRVPT